MTLLQMVLLPVGKWQTSFGDTFEHVCTKILYDANDDLFVAFVWRFYNIQEGRIQYAGSKTYKEVIVAHRAVEW